jgi:hypothetical protein
MFQPQWPKSFLGLIALFSTRTDGGYSTISPESEQQTLFVRVAVIVASSTLRSQWLPLCNAQLAGAVIRRRFTFEGRALRVAQLR